MEEKVQNIDKYDELFMLEALKEASFAMKADEVPVGAVIVRDGRVIARGRNSRETDNLPTSHAEMRAINEAAHKTGHWRLLECTLYVTMEPCVMCAGAIINARIPRVVFGAYDKRFGAFGSVYSIHEGKLNHTPQITGGVLEPECRKLLQDFFSRKR